MTLEEYKQSWATQYVPLEVAELQEKIIKQAKKDGYEIGKADSLKIITRGYQTKN